LYLPVFVHADKLHKSRGLMVVVAIPFSPLSVLRKPMDKKAFFSQTFNEFTDWSQARGQGVKPLKRMVVSLVKGSSFFDKDSEFSSAFLASVSKEFFLNDLRLIKKHVSKDKTVKYLFALEDGLSIESVALPFNKRFTLCLSSQAGCGMNCQFCSTGSVGLKRNLAAHEIVHQYLSLWHDLNKDGQHPQTPNVVFMGQGEPLHNFDQLKRAIEILGTTPGLSLGPKQITLSTVGYLPGLKRFAELPDVNLALSLHSPFNHQRDELIPMNKAYAIEDLFSVLKTFKWHDRKRINFEYLLLGGVNDSLEHASALAELISQFPNLVNLIPFNPYPGSKYLRPSNERVQAFKKRLVEHKVMVMIRQTKGDDVLAACGQLANSQ